MLQSPIVRMNPISFIWIQPTFSIRPGNASGLHYLRRNVFRSSEREAQLRHYLIQHLFRDINLWLGCHVAPFMHLKSESVKEKDSSKSQ